MALEMASVPECPRGPTSWLIQAGTVCFIGVHLVDVAHTVERAISGEDRVPHRVQRQFTTHDRYFFARLSLTASLYHQFHDNMNKQYEQSAIWKRKTITMNHIWLL